MYIAEITERFIEPPNVKEFTYNELLRDAPLEGAVTPIVYPGEDTDGKVTYVRPSVGELYAQLSVYDTLSYKSTTPGLYLIDQVPANTNEPVNVRYRTQMPLYLLNRGWNCFDDLKPIRKGDYFWLVGTESYKIDGVLYEPADILLFKEDCDVGVDVTPQMLKHTKNFKLLKSSYGKERGYKELRILKQTLYIPAVDSYCKYNKIDSVKLSNAYDVLTLYLPKQPVDAEGIWFEPTLRFYPKYS